MANSCNTQAKEPEWAAFAAIDWADQKHFWRLVKRKPRDSLTV